MQMPLLLRIIFCHSIFSSAIIEHLLSRLQIPARRSQIANCELQITTTWNYYTESNSLSRSFTWRQIIRPGGRRLARLFLVIAIRHYVTTAPTRNAIAAISNLSLARSPAPARAKNSHQFSAKTLERSD